MAFKKHIYTQIHLAATPTQVWQILTHTSSYPNWNPFITSIEGKLYLGEQLKVQIQDMQFKPTIIKLVPEQELQWLGKLFIKGLFDGKHIFRLEEQADGTTILHHEEYFSGLLVPLFAQQLEGKTKAGFEAMNQAIRQQLSQKQTSL